MNSDSKKREEQFVEVEKLRRADTALRRAAEREGAAADVRIPHNFSYAVMSKVDDITVRRHRMLGVFDTVALVVLGVVGVLAVGYVLYRSSVLEGLKSVLAADLNIFKVGLSRPDILIPACVCAAFFPVLNRILQKIK